MGWSSLVLIVAAAVAGLDAMRAAIDRGDIDEATRLGIHAGARGVERALAAPDRAARLAGIAAAPHVEGRIELLDALAAVARSGDRRVALPAARAARTIARELARRGLPDDLAPDDIAALRVAWVILARDAGRPIDLRVLALDTAAALEPGGIGVALGSSLGDPDPAFRRAVIEVVPAPVPDAMRGPLVAAVIEDGDPAVALAAAHVLCADLVAAPARPLLDALGGPGLARIRSLVTGPGPAPVVRDAARCLAADGSPESAAALRALQRRP